ncbi:MAG: acyltransferase [Paludibacteraceae bacterium]|nr:acyltransferase [Paludibacteraceae bacterium]
MKLMLKLEYKFKKFASIIHTYYIKLLDPRIIIGVGSIIYYKSSILNLAPKGRVEIGKNSRLGCSSKRYHSGMPFYSKILIDGSAGLVQIGDNTRVNGAYIHARNCIKIGNKCVIATGTHIIDSNGHLTQSLNRTEERDEPKEIVIGDNVWIGLNVIILKGTHIGDNCVVSAGSIVKGSYPRNSLISGNPAVVTKELII